MRDDLRRRPYGPNIVDTKFEQRAILKNGEYNILKPKFHHRYISYLKDIFTSLVDAEWKWTLQVLAIGFLGTWLTFALLWWLIAFVHLDLHDEHLPHRQAESGWTPCVLNIYGFHSCFLYSMETQHTTGYGLRAITEECPEAIFIMCAQCIIGMIIESFAVGVVFAKFTRPMLTTCTIQFTSNAVVCLRDGELCMMFRVGDLRKSRIVGVCVRALLIHNKKTKEGERLKHFETHLDVQCDDLGSELLIIWPLMIIHKINKDSPFYNLSAVDMLHHKFEVVAILDGTIESTGQNTHAKTSYLPDEILWGQRFESMVAYNEDLEAYEADYRMFDKTTKVEIDTCSASQMEEKTSLDLSRTGNSQNIRKRYQRRCSLPNAPLQPLPRRNSINVYLYNKSLQRESLTDEKGIRFPRKLPQRPSNVFTNDISSRSIYAEQSVKETKDRGDQKLASYLYYIKNSTSYMKNLDYKSPVENINPVDVKVSEDQYVSWKEDGRTTPPFPVAWL